MSALKADAQAGPSNYLRSKGAAEAIVQEHCAPAVNYTIFQPSVIFGLEDDFINRFARLLALLPVFPLARPNARFGPVHVEDVVTAMVRAMDDPGTYGQTYQLCGPKVYSLREVVQFTADCLGLKRKIIGLPDGLARLQARVLERLPGTPFSMDNYYSLTVHTICDVNGFEYFQFRPRSMESIVPAYLGHRDRNKKLSRYRQAAGRS